MWEAWEDGATRSVRRPGALCPCRQSEPGDLPMCVVHVLIKEGVKEMSRREDCGRNMFQVRNDF